MPRDYTVLTVFHWNIYKYLLCWIYLDHHIWKSLKQIGDELRKKYNKQTDALSTKLDEFSKKIKQTEFSFKLMVDDYSEEKKIQEVERVAQRQVSCDVIS